MEQMIEIWIRETQETYERAKQNNNHYLMMDMLILYHELIEKRDYIRMSKWPFNVQGN